MPAPTLRALLSPRSSSLPALKALLGAANDEICISEVGGKTLLGVAAKESADHARVPVEFEGTTLGFVAGPSASANAIALLLTHLAARESEGRGLASEILHLYREVHLIEQLSEQLAALLDLSAVSQSALGQAQRLIAATHGGILVMEEADGSLRNAASFGPTSVYFVDGSGPLLPGSLFAASILERGIAEIVNNCDSDPRAGDSE